METIISLIAACTAYYIFVWCAKFSVFIFACIKNTTKNQKARFNILRFMLSPDFCSSHFFKNLIKIERNDEALHNKKNPNKLSVFIQSANFFNLIASIALALITFLLVAETDCKTLQDIVIYVALFRFCSRSIEIAQAFYKDTTQKCKDRNSSLDKYDRIKLAMISYVEIYIYAAPAYLFLCGNNIKDAITLSLNVGSLTNVGMAFSAGSDFFNIIVFVQVFTTMILVILSLASYISRPETE